MREESVERTELRERDAPLDREAYDARAVIDARHRVVVPPPASNLGIVTLSFPLIPLFSDHGESLDTGIKMEVAFARFLMEQTSTTREKLRAAKNVGSLVFKVQGMRPHPVVIKCTLHC